MELPKQKYIFDLINGLYSLMFPNICCCCGQTLNKQEDAICMTCLFKLPKTNFHLHKSNSVAQKFDGRMPITAASAFLFFRKGNTCQILLHLLKYSGREDIGERLGALYGKELKMDSYILPDLLIPLPLHPAKLKLRGYNQCHSIARGMRKYLDIPIGYGVVKRIVANSTQTQKARYERWLNVSHIFKVDQPEKILGRHVLLLDDVVTTGSTLEACGRKLLEAGAREISIITLALA